MSVAVASKNPIDLPRVLVGLMADFLDEKAAFVTTCVSRRWRDSLELKKRRGKVIEGHYPAEIVEAFKSGGLPIAQFPVLNLRGRMGGTDYVDFLWPVEVIQPMRFRDRYGRYGFALTVVAQAPIVRKKVWREIGEDLGRVFQERDIARFPEIFRRAMTALRGWENGREGTLIMAQRFTSLNTYWYVLWNTWPLPNLGSLLQGRHLRTDHERSALENCPRCPFTEQTICIETFLRPLLEGGDPDFQIKGYLPRKKSQREGLSRALLITSLAVAVLAYLIQSYSRDLV